MRQYTETEHCLEARTQRGDSWTIWQRPEAGLLRPAVLLAYQGRLTEAIEEAQRLYIENYENMHGIEFRCMTKTRTVTVATGAIEADRFGFE